jgi:hypothetical protein
MSEAKEGLKQNTEKESCVALGHFLWCRNFDLFMMPEFL